MHHIKRLSERYPWLKVQVEDGGYLPPNYYDKLLKPYIFKGKDDLSLLRDYLIRVAKNRSGLKCLELGCGTGRSTAVILDMLDSPELLDIVDISSKMLDHTKNRYREFSFLRFFEKDHIEFLEDCTQTYDLVVSLWSYSHSIHENIFCNGLEKAKARMHKVLLNFFKKHFANKGVAFIVHMDAQSEEQRILLKQWQRLYPILNDFPGQTPSKVLTDEILQICKDKKILDFNCKHFVGEPILYDSLEGALECFFNFHMEGRFNCHNDLDTIIDEVCDDIAKYEANGGYLIRPGCFIYEIRKSVC